MRILTIFLLYSVFEFGQSFTTNISILKKSLSISGNGKTALHVAVTSNRLEVVIKLLKNGANANAATWDNHETPLHIAARKGYDQIIEVLVEYGANVSLTMEGQYTPLLLAAINDRLSSIELLVEAGSDVDARDYMNHTSLYHAIDLNSREVMEKLVGYGANVNHVEYSHMERNLLQVAIELNSRENYIGNVKFLLQHGANVNSMDYYGYTALHLAIINNDIKSFEIVEMLIEHDADVNIKSKEDGTPLDIARKYGNADIIDILIKNGAKGGKTSNCTSYPQAL